MHLRGSRQRDEELSQQPGQEMLSSSAECVRLVRDLFLPIPSWLVRRLMKSIPSSPKMRSHFRVYTRLPRQDETRLAAGHGECQVSGEARSSLVEAWNHPSSSGIIHGHHPWAPSMGTSWKIRARMSLKPRPQLAGACLLCAHGQQHTSYTTANSRLSVG